MKTIFRHMAIGLLSFSLIVTFGIIDFAISSFSNGLALARSRNYKPNQSSNLDFHEFVSAISGRQEFFHVLTPPGWGDFSKGNTSEQLRVIYWLHGANGNSRSLEPLSSRFRRAMELGLIPKSFVVFPNSPALSMWVDAKSRKTLSESVFINEIMPRFYSLYKVRNDRATNIVAGFSMGGYGAARFAFKYPDRFSGLHMIGAGTLDASLENTPRASDEVKNKVFSSVYGNDESYFLNVSPRQLAASYAKLYISKYPLKIRIIAGTNDEVFNQNLDFHQYLNSLGIESNFIALPGTSHNLRQYVSSMGASFWSF